VWVSSPTGAYGPVEDMHHVICHVLATCLSARAVEMEPAWVSSAVAPPKPRL
jgi:hypothetical protein